MEPCWACKASTGGQRSVTLHGTAALPGSQHPDDAGLAWPAQHLLSRCHNILTPGTAHNTA